MGVQPHEVDQANEDMRRDGNTSGQYLKKDTIINGVRVPAGTFVTDSRRSRAQEMKRRDFFDKDAGYSDHAGS